MDEGPVELCRTRHALELPLLKRPLFVHRRGSKEPVLAVGGPATRRRVLTHLYVRMGMCVTGCVYMCSLTYM